MSEIKIKKLIPTKKRFSLPKKNYSLKTINKTVQKVNPSPIKQSVPIDIKKSVKSHSTPKSCKVKSISSQEQTSDDNQKSNKIENHSKMIHSNKCFNSHDTPKSSKDKTIYSQETPKPSQIVKTRLAKYIASSEDTSSENEESRINRKPMKHKAILDDESSENEAEHKFVLVKWVGNKLEFTVLPAINVICNKNPLCGITYKVKYNKEVYEAIVLKLGTKVECEKQLDVVCGYNSVETPKKIRKTQATEDLTIIEEIDYKSLLNERDNHIRELSTKLNIAKKQLGNKENEYDLLVKSIDICDKQRFIELAKVIIKGFATHEDLIDLPLPVSIQHSKEKFVRLSERFIDVLVPMTLKINIESEISQNKPATKIFRLLIGSIITDDKIWASANADKIMNDYPDLTSACFDFLIQNKVDFTTKIMRRVLREVCSEARRKLNRIKEYKTIDLDNVENGASLIQMTMTKSITMTSITSIQ